MMKKKPYRMSFQDVMKYGFRWGAADITRCCTIRGTNILSIVTDREELQINITPTGKLKAFKLPRK